MSPTQLAKKRRGVRGTVFYTVREQTFAVGLGCKILFCTRKLMDKRDVG